MTKLNNIVLVFLLSSCASLTGPEGAFPDTKYDFLDEELSDDVVTTNDLELRGEEDHYPIDVAAQDTIFQEVPKPRQIFSAGGASEVQLRRLGDLLWIYAVSYTHLTLPTIYSV